MMIQDLCLIAALAFIAACGARCAKRAFGIKVFGVALSVGFPLGTAIFILLTTALRPLFSPLVSALGGALGLLLFTLSFTFYRRLRRPTQELPPPDAPESFGRCTLVAFALVLLLALLSLRLGQLSALSPDFCTNYPFFRALLLNGNNLQAPFFPAQTYAGSLPYAVLIASLSLVAQGDVLRTEWILQAVLLLDAIIIWALTLRFFLRRALPAALATALLFGGALTPSLAIQTTLDYANLLDAAIIGALLNCYLTLLRYNRQHQVTPPLAGLTAGALTMCATQLFPLIPVLLWLGLWGLCAIYSLRRQATASVLRRSIIAITLYTALWGAPQLLYWQQVSTLWNQGLLGWPHLTAPLFQVTMPVDAFNVNAGSRVSLFSWPALGWHTAVFFLGWPLIAWVLWRRSRKGLVLWMAAIFFFLWPGLVEGIAHPWRCELISDILMAILLGYAIGDVYQLWSRQRSSLSAHFQRLVLGLTVLGLTAGFWSSLATMYRDYPCPEEKLSHLFWPFYPATEQWLASVPQLELTPEQLEIADFLWQQQERPLRTLFAPPNLDSISWAHLSLWAGQSGAIPVGFASPRQSLRIYDLRNSLTDIYSGFSSENTVLPAPATLAFMQQPRQDVLLGLGAEVIVSSPWPSDSNAQPAGKGSATSSGNGGATSSSKGSASSSSKGSAASSSKGSAASSSNGNASSSENGCASSSRQSSSSLSTSAMNAPLPPWYCTSTSALSAYRLDNTFPWQRRLLPYPNPKVTISVSNVPELDHRCSGVAYSVKIHANTKLQGWLWPQWQDARTNVPLPLAPLTLFVDGKDTVVPLVFPYQPGDYELTWLYCPQENLPLAPADTPTNIGYATAGPNSASTQPDNTAAVSSNAPTPPSDPLTVDRLTGTTELSQQFAATLEQNLRLVKVEQCAPRAGLAILKNVGTAPLDCGTHLRVQWQVWSPLQHGYISSESRQETMVTLPLKPGASTTIHWQCAYDVNSQDRLDFNVGPRFGSTYPVIRQFTNK